MKRIFFLIITLGMSISTMMAESGTCGNNLTWDLTDGVLTISGTGGMTNWDDSPNYTDIPWYSFRSDIISVIINSGVTSIGNRAFFQCSSLENVEIPSTVTSIGEEAFYVCTTLPSITIPINTNNIGNGAFKQCCSLISIAVENGNSTYDNRNNCNAIIETATNTLIVGCQNTIIPSSVTSIGNYSFYGRIGLTEIEIPSSVTSIGDGAFSGCTGLTSLTLPNSVINIGSYAFSGCTNLISADISDNVTGIEAGLFERCRNLTSINIPNSVTKIGENAFAQCAKLSAVTIGSGVKEIENWAFSDCSALTTITIPRSVINISNLAFSSCLSLASIVVESGNSTYDSRNNCNAIIETATNKLIVGCQNTIIPKSVMCIGDNAFYECSSLINIDIPDSVISIGEMAFYQCTSLTKVSFGKMLTDIGEGAFNRCSAIKNLDIPKNVQRIGSFAFGPNSVMDTVICRPIVPPAIDSSTFYLSSNPILIVPKESFSAYSTNKFFAYSFAEMHSFSEVEDITATSASLKWLTDPEVSEYVIDIYEGESPFAHYVVNGAGKIISPEQPVIARIIQHKMDTTTSSSDYFVISLEGLNAGTDYTYTINGTDVQGTPIYHESGAFHTNEKDAPSAFSNAVADDPRKQARKILQNGQLYILRGDKTYTPTGIKMK